MDILVCGNYVNYYVWSSYILIQYSSTKVGIIYMKKSQRFPITCMFKTYVRTIQRSIRILLLLKHNHAPPKDVWKI